MQRIVLLAAVAIIFAASSVQANPRGAASKIMGDYSFDTTTPRAARMTFAPVQTESRRSFSYEAPATTATSKAPATTSKSPAAPQAAPSQPQRRYSYEPSAARPIRMFPQNSQSPRYLHADSKIRGHFDY